jgi:ABC-type sugar transport system ATPase subunit
MGDTMQKAIEVTNLCKQYSQEVLKNFSLSVNEGEMVVLLGESGCGKSTFIRILAGLENADSGSVYLNGIFMDDRTPPNKRNIALVYQEPVLWNHMPVWKNIAYGMAKKDKKVIYELMDALEIGGLEKRFPEEISGGQAKRVALARALAADKGILLLDEPLSNIDEKTKLKNLEYLVQNYKDRKTILYVTHSKMEADFLGCRQIRMDVRDENAAKTFPYI